MRIGWTSPVPPRTSAKSTQRSPNTGPSLPPLEVELQQTSPSESRIAYDASGGHSPVHESDIQVKNYVMTVLFRQNWAEKSSRFNTNTLPPREGFGYQDPFYWQPEKVAQRVVNFAKAVAGNDLTAIDHLKESALKGISDAEKMLGGTDSLQKTYDVVLQAFDAWKFENASL